MVHSFSKLLSFYGANVTCTSIEDEFILNDIDIKYIKADLRYFDKCLEITKNQDVVFNLIGIKGSPQMAINKPSSFLPLQFNFNTNLIEAAVTNNVNDFMYTSSIGVYSPADIFEDDVWETFPHEMIGLLDGQREWVNYKLKLIILSTTQLIIT